MATIGQSRKLPDHENFPSARQDAKPAGWAGKTATKSAVVSDEPGGSTPRTAVGEGKNRAAAVIPVTAWGQADGRATDAQTTSVLRIKFIVGNGQKSKGKVFEGVESKSRRESGSSEFF